MLFDPRPRFLRGRRELGIMHKMDIIMAITSEGLNMNAGIELHMSRDEKACAGSLIEDIRSRAVMEKGSSRLVFPNGMGGDGLKILKRLQGVLGEDFEVAGGYLGDDMRFKHTFQYSVL